MSLRAIFHRFGGSQEIFKVETLILKKKYKMIFLERMQGRHDPWILHLQCGKEIKRFFAPNGVKLKLEATMKKRKEKFRVVGYFKLIARKENGCTGYVDFDMETLSRCMRDDVRKAKFMV
jgi:hypothetical protein